MAIDRHEIPSASAMKKTLGVATEDVPAVQLPTRIHAKTATFAGGSEARIARDAEARLIQQGQITDAFNSGVADVKRIINSSEGKAILKSTGFNVNDVNKALDMMTAYFNKTFGKK